MPNRLDRGLIRRLTACHATPGDEGQVRELLERQWRQAGWEPARLGDYAVTATDPRSLDPAAPVLLVCAHMDSPGYAIHACGQQNGKKYSSRKHCWHLTSLGSPTFTPPEAPGMLKCAAGLLPVTLRTGWHADAQAADPDYDEGGETVFCTADGATIPVGLPESIRPGDRVCFTGEAMFTGGKIAAPFLDNRVGCWLLADLPRLSRDWPMRHRLVVAATALEEFTGQGAAVLAHHLRPDLTIVLDATYVSEEQNVKLGNGPVLTLSDRSVVISPARRDMLMDFFAASGLPLQTEVYNFSGTDARAFPAQGVFTPVLPLLIPSTGNHTPLETASLADVATLLDAIGLLATTRLIDFRS